MPSDLAGCLVVKLRSFAQAFSSQSYDCCALSLHATYFCNEQKLVGYPCKESTYGALGCANENVVVSSMAFPNSVLRVH